MECTLAVDDTGAWSDYVGDSVTHENSLSSGLAAADRQLAIDLAMADAQFLVDVMTAQRDFQIAEATGDPDAELDKQVALADAQYEWSVLKADAELGWRLIASPLIGTCVANEAGSLQGLAVDLAANEVGYTNGYAGGIVTLLDADAIATADYSAGQALAASTFRTATATVQSEFWAAQYDADVAALQTFAQDMDTPWAQFKADQAVARHDWWEDQHQAFLAWYAGIAAAESAYQALVGAAWAARSAAMGAADTAYVSTWAHADETQFVSTSQADEIYVETMAGGYQAFQAQLAYADHDYQLSVAAAQYALDVGGSQTDYDNAIAAANAARAAAYRVAGDAYVLTDTTADGQRRVAQAQARLVHAQVVGPAKVAWVGAYSTAKLTHVTAESTAHVAVVTDVANGTAAYRTQEAGALYTALVDLATEHPSPWATYMRDKVGAWHDYVLATAPAQAAYEIAMAESQAALEIAQTEAQNAYDEALARAEAQDMVAAAQAAVDRAVAERQADEAIVAAAGVPGAQADPGKRPPRPPAPPVPPPLNPGTAGQTPPTAAVGTYQTGQGATGPVGTAASVSIADLPTDDEPVRNFGHDYNLFARTGKKGETSHNNGSVVGQMAYDDAVIAKDGRLWGGGNHRDQENKQRVQQEIKPIMEVVADVGLSIATFGKKDEIEVWAGYNLARGEHLTTGQQVTQGVFVYGVPLLGGVAGSLLRNGSKLANALRGTAKVVDDVDGVLKSGLKAGDNVADVGRVAPSNTLAAGIDRTSRFLRVLPSAKTASRLERFAEMKGIKYTFDPNVTAPFTNAKTGVVTFRGIPGKTTLADVPIIDIADEFAHAWGIKNPNLVGATAKRGAAYWRFHQELFGRASILRGLTGEEAEALQWAEREMIKELNRLNSR